MNYMQYIYGDDANGDGMRCTLFVSGCEMMCKGCHNPESWKLNAGKLYTKEFEDNIIQDLQSPWIKGLSLSGGHPLHITNFDTVLSLCKRVKNELPDKDIWLWTGHTLEEVQNDTSRSQILDVVDVLVDGKFILELKDTNLEWRGSSNQRIFIKGGCNDNIRLFEV
ncbi:TPA: anaerobic ribonucleoside-triphosphate reductase activating protein [Vibrio cholerae]|uniref:Anaerobic ribonucleoside-triphosphate reductase-activating protein n=1 Tax=Vibrio phage ICP1 TaxID=979525 RepID=F1D1D6_9CAUD|nr:anaerobic ribonucleotide reductase small subunit [Vibrio phage ICP1]ADX88160.1 anaerobic NTP reductase small subunit [Vibrio phage ICP1_2006_D]ADX88387.1 anaerobic NTP reductase small subunit [Vibrio phage ICP1_2006_C]ASV41437.1 ribonucleotide reductase of class III (anaerobic), activating protein [Vibrio phage JSF6]ASV41834.1 ribonucleotide reductase of class III (anaerobic), activating protein [Vibrio phage JSF1]ASV41974.1 ribonucleotide reductase of class III (anaerobic), activating prot